MVSSARPSVQKIAAFGLVGSVAAASTPAAAIAQETETASPAVPLQCVVTVPDEVQGAPSIQDIAAQEEKVTQVEAEELPLREELARAEAAQEEAERNLRAIQDDPSGVNSNSSEVNQAMQDRAQILA